MLCRRRVGVARSRADPEWWSRDIWRGAQSRVRKLLRLRKDYCGIYRLSARRPGLAGHRFLGSYEWDQEQDGTPGSTGNVARLTRRARVRGPLLPPFAVIC
ncbi:hypothetical protein AGOR_G00047780 [Albula goreensis]|uniref:Uncharacterized protein n=1 Tax=Albula goreensis TaxID=1534307 RepID=A0A8T3DTN6_9TELE|nr:hypothetical protein AGOR_G00047780 [Albula goreensis]